MALGVPCGKCRKLEVSHPKHPAEKPINGACEKYVPSNRASVERQNYLRYLGFSWIVILDGNKKNLDEI
jgi:hypothetical protein